jgi:hypothetical protein
MLCTMNRPRPIPLAALLLTWLLAAPSQATDAPTTVYRCGAPGDPPAFSQFPCAAAAAAVRVEPPQTFVTPPLGEAEQRWLKGLADERRAQEAARERQAERAAQALRQQAVTAQQRCRAARDGLAALARQRRKGYTLGEAAELERRESELTAARRENC